MSHQLYTRAPNSGKPTENEGLIIEGWIEGFMLGALIVICCITISNMRRGVLLHKLILLELLLGLCSGIAIFNNPAVYGWYISATGTCMYISYGVHNVVAWMKNRPFLKKKASYIYIGTVLLVQPYWIMESYANFTYFNGHGTLFVKTRPLETLFRDPWWVWTTVSLFWNLKVRYDFKVTEMFHISPRFVILMVAMCLSLCFMILDVLAVTKILGSVFLTGINPFWKLSFIFKCLTDSVILDDFKTVLDKLYQVKLGRIRSSNATTDPYSDAAEAVRDHPHMFWRRPSMPKAGAQYVDHVNMLELGNVSQATRNEIMAQTTARREGLGTSREVLSRPYEIV